jgi:hypothetical protein
MLQKIALFIVATALTMPALTAMSADVSHYNPGTVKGFGGSQPPRAGAGRIVTRNGSPGGKPNPAGNRSNTNSSSGKNTGGFHPSKGIGQASPQLLNAPWNSPPSP